MEGEGPSSPKRQKTEGADPVGGGESTQSSSFDRSVVNDVGGKSGPAQSPSSTSSSSVNSGEEEFGDLDAPDREPIPLDYWSEEEMCLSAAEGREIMWNQTTSIAQVALESYYNHEGVRYVLEKPLISFCFPMEGVIVCHANFTANAEKVVFDNDSSFSESFVSPTPTPSELFFAETAQVIGRDVKVTCCSIMDPSSNPDGVREGCLYCKKGRDPVFYHPRGGEWKYGCQAALKFGSKKP